MKILQVCSAESLGGGEKHVIDLTRGLVERGHELHLAVRPGGPLRDALSGIPIYWHELALRNASDLSSAWRLAKIIERHHIEILHAHVARDYPICGLASRFASVNFFLTRHHFNPIKSNLLYASLLSNASRLIAVSESVRSELIKAFPRFAEKIEVIPNWVDLRHVGQITKAEARTSLGITHRLAVGVIGQITPLKRQDLFLRAISQLDRDQKLSDVEFVLAGAATSKADQAYAQQLIDLTYQLQLTNKVRLTGFVSDIAAKLTAFDVVVAPSINEAFSLALVEAMAAGCACLATNVGGMAEIVADKVTGLLVPADDEKALSEALRALLSDEKLRAELGRQAKLSAQQKFDREKVIDRIEKLYRDCEA